MTPARVIGGLCVALVLCACSGGRGTTSATGGTSPTPGITTAGSAVAGESAVTIRPVLVEEALPQARSATSSRSPSPSPSGTAVGSAPPSTAAGRPVPTDASDLSWITPEIEATFVALDCRSTPPSVDGVPPTRPLVTCSATGDGKYILGPAELTGQDFADAQAQRVPGAQAAAWMVVASTTEAGRARLQAVTERLARLHGSRNRFALVVNGAIVSAPVVQEAITGGVLQIVGNFTHGQAQALASALRARTS